MNCIPTLLTSLLLPLTEILSPHWKKKSHKPQFGFYHLKISFFSLQSQEFLYSPLVDSNMFAASIKISLLHYNLTAVNMDEETHTHTLEFYSTRSKSHYFQETSRLVIIMLTQIGHIQKNEYSCFLSCVESIIV